MATRYPDRFHENFVFRKVTGGKGGGRDHAVLVWSLQPISHTHIHTHTNTRCFYWALVFRA